MKTRHKNISIFVILCLICAVSFVILSQRPYHPAAIKTKSILPPNVIDLKEAPLPAVEWETLNGEPFDIKTLEGQFVILNFWATWCPPCLVEFPELVEFLKKHPDHFTVVFVSNDRDVADIQTFIKRENLDINKDNIIMIHDKQGRITRDVFQTYKLPESYILNREGKMIYKVIGVLEGELYQRLSNLAQGN